MLRDTSFLYLLIDDASALLRTLEMSSARRIDNTHKSCELCILSV